jgi:hypothetical protein
MRNSRLCLIPLLSLLQLAVLAARGGAGQVPHALISPISVLPAPHPAFGGQAACQHITAQTNLGARPIGSEVGWKTASTLGFAQVFIPQYKWTMIDDHIPFAQRVIPAADLIDFDYPTWHTTGDTADKVSPERFGLTLKTWLEQTPP